MDYILETRNLTKKIKSENIIKGISLKIPKGETYGLLGPNGAGKSTTMKLLCGLLKPSSGEIIFNGKQWSKDALSKIGVLIENPARSWLLLALPTVQDTVNRTLNDF